MATRKQKAAPASGAKTNAALAAWPFPTTRHDDVVDPAVEREDFQSDFDAHADATHPLPDDRIRVDAINLYTDPALNVIERVDLQLVFESPFNPRTHYDEKALAELAETIRGVGVMQPILVRPIDMPITRNDVKQQAFEIVFGHRRYRAAKIAGEESVPVIKRELTDGQSAQLQAIENVQREDLDPIEEAKGYANYLQVHGVNKDQLAKEIGLSRSHVYSRLKLLQAVPVVHEALQRGEIYEENALYIARLPSAKLQEKAIASLRSNHMDLEDGGKRSVRRIKDFLRERFTLQLSGAIFDPKDAGLLELAGSCTDCAKRSGNSPEHEDLAADTDIDWKKRPLAGPDLCTDPDCFDRKKKAHLRAEAEALVAKGKTVIEGGKARAAISAHGEVKGAYIALKDVKSLLAKAKNAPKLGELPVVSIQDPRDGKVHQAMKVEDLPASIKPKAKAAVGGDAAAAGRRHEADAKKREVARELERRVNHALLAAVRLAAAGRPLSELALRLVTARMFGAMDWDDRELLAEQHQFKHPDALDAKLQQLPAERLATLLLDCALVFGVEPSWNNDKPEALLAMAKELGVDAAAIRKEITATAADTKTQDLLQGAEQVEEEEAAEA